MLHKFHERRNCLVRRSTAATYIFLHEASPPVSAPSRASAFNWQSKLRILDALSDNTTLGFDSELRIPNELRHVAGGTDRSWVAELAAYFVKHRWSISRGFNISCRHVSNICGSMYKCSLKLGVLLPQDLMGTTRGAHP